jgi:hypothetical protein
MTDWFRKRTWTESDEADFWQRLKRARAHNKAQYLRIQASHLAGVGSAELRQVALRLLTLLILEFPSRLELSCAFAQRGDIHRRGERISEALADYRSAIEQERAFPNAKTMAWLRFGSLIALLRMRLLYDEALTVLRERESDAMFPVDLFVLHAVRSLIAEDRGAIEDAERLAKLAIAFATKVHSGLRYHPKLGLVESEGCTIREILHSVEEKG